MSEHILAKYFYAPMAVAQPTLPTYITVKMEPFTDEDLKEGERLGVLEQMQKINEIIREIES